MAFAEVKKVRLINFVPTSSGTEEQWQTRQPLRKVVALRKKRYRKLKKDENKVCKICRFNSGAANTRNAKKGFEYGPLLHLGKLI